MGVFADRCDVGARIPAGQGLVTGVAGRVQRARTRGRTGPRGASGPGRWSRSGGAVPGCEARTPA